VLIQAKRRVLTDLLDNKGQYLLLVFFLVVGITAGTFTVSNMQDGSKEALRSYISAVFLSAQTTQVDFLKVFLHALFQDTLVFGVIAMFSLMVLGIPCIALTVVAKGFCVGFTVGVLALNLGGAGGFLAIVFCAFFSNLVLIPCVLKAGVIGIRNAMDVFKARHIPKTSADKLAMSRPFFRRMLVIYAVSLIGVLIESLLTPLLIKTL
jgi:stage II sporulation protein M